MVSPYNGVYADDLSLNGQLFSAVQIGGLTSIDFLLLLQFIEDNFLLSIGLSLILN